MSKERLDKIRNGVRMVHGNYKDVVIDAMDFDWLAERVQELEKYNTKLLVQKQREHIELDELNKQNKRYREAIAKIKESPRKAHSGSDCVDIIFEIIEELESDSDV